MPPAGRFLKKAPQKLLQNWCAETLRRFEPRTAHAQKRERALFVCRVARGVYVLRALARRTKMTRITPYNEVFADFAVKISPKVFEGRRELFSKSSLHVFPDKLQFII